jgi:hypothetical protein
VGLGGFGCLKSGDTYSRTFGTTIGSESLTTVFGMGTGVAFQIWSPERGGGRVFRRPAAMVVVVQVAWGQGWAGHPGPLGLWGALDTCGQAFVR